MNDDDVHADQFEQDNVTRKTLFEAFVHHRIAAEFNDDGSSG